jgi:hypothetical protein
MLEEKEKLVIIVMNTDEMLIAYTKNAKSFVDGFKRVLNESFEATPREKAEYYMGMHIVRDRDRGLLGFDAWRHVYNFIWHMGRDPESLAGVSTPLDPNETYSKQDCPIEVNIKLREKVWSAHWILIHLSIWARPDFAHALPPSLPPPPPSPTLSLSLSPSVIYLIVNKILSLSLSLSLSHFIDRLSLPPSLSLSLSLARARALSCLRHLTALPGHCTPCLIIIFYYYYC